jgi:hypothetical protein
MKKLFFNISFVVMALMGVAMLASCSDYFNPETDDELDGKKYISSSTEMYTGFLGIMTKLQAVGDKEILLTDTRADLLEPTTQSSADIIALYNYDKDLQGNPYANPAGYYEVIIACNDYLAKMKEYKSKPNVDKMVYESLVSSVTRIKVWTYKTIGEIYGKAVWFDDPITKVSAIRDSTNYQVLDMPQLVDKCLDVMDNGVDGVPANKTIDWIAWLDPQNVSSVANSQYRKWNWMVPPYEGVLAELCLWKGAYLDAAGADATSYYQRAADQLLKALNVYIDDENYSGNSPYYLPCATTPGHYKSFWDWEQPYQAEAVCALIYDYTNNQTNTLLKHFSNEYPNQYQLRPNELEMEHYSDKTFNPGGTDGDTRTKCLFGKSGGEDYIAKFRPVGSTHRANAFQDDVHIYLYRATQYHMMLAEALNHLDRFKALDAVLNTGVKATEYSETDPEWRGFTQNWTSSAAWGTRKYPSMGIRGCLNLNAVGILKNIAQLGSRKATERHNDELILNEIMMEFACEGKTYPAMNRMAVRYGDPSIITSRVCRKYEGTGHEADVRAKIMDGGYWVPYEMDMK